MTKQLMLIEEIKTYIMACKSSVADLEFLMCPSDKEELDAILNRLNYAQGLLDDLSNMS